MILFDTNIFIDMLGGCPQATIELNAYDEPAISVITLPLVTRNPIDFQQLEIPVHVPYDYDPANKVVSNIRTHYSPDRPAIIRIK